MLTDLRAECDPGLLERDRCQMGWHPVRWLHKKGLQPRGRLDDAKIGGVPERRRTFGLNI
jgi:hypothetical protein